MLRRAVATLAALVVSLAAARAGDTETEKAKAEPCMSCHGPTGNAEIAGVPSLAGQPALYLTMQLILFRDKQRNVPEMTPFASGLTDAEIADLAALFAAQTLAPPQIEQNPAKIAAGKRVADANHCGACHLPTYAGRDQMPRLAGQREDYLLKALHDYKSGERPGFDGTMTSALYPLTSEDLDALAHFLATLD